jgi:mannose-6-phosphate isomerase-like protein (cupin superfamily)
MTKHINLYSKFDKFGDYWSPKVIAEMNDYQFKLVKIKGEFVKHQHSDTDEVFIVIEGKMSIEFETETIEIKNGEMIVVPKGVDLTARTKNKSMDLKMFKSLYKNFYYF